MVYVIAIPVYGYYIDVIVRSKHCTFCFFYTMLQNCVRKILYCKRIAMKISGLVVNVHCDSINNPDYRMQPVRHWSYGNALPRHTGVIGVGLNQICAGVC